MSRYELKMKAKADIQGNILIWFVINLIGLGASALVGGIPVLGAAAVAVFVTPVVSIAITIILLDQAKGIKPEIGALFHHFDKWWTAFKVTFLTGLFTALWSMLFVIPGIVKGLSYSMSMYILAENPEIGAREAIERSKRMMHGHKMELFVLNLSFIGWHLLGAITFGIAYVWVAPYIDATITNFYNDIKNQPVIE